MLAAMLKDFEHQTIGYGGDFVIQNEAKNCLQTHTCNQGVLKVIGNTLKLS